MRYLVINLTRMGDIVQTTALTGAIKKNNSNAVIDFLAMKSFEAILKQNPYINNVVSINDDLIFDNVKNNPIIAYNQLSTVVDEINKTHYDVVINPVVSIESSILTYLINAKQKFGIRFNSDKQQIIQQKFTAFHLANEHNLGDHGLNSVDIFSQTANFKPNYDVYNLKFSDKAMQNAQHFYSKLKGKTVVGFHVGANRSNKAWESYKFVNVIQKLLQDESMAVILFGGYSEEKLINQFNQIKSPNFYNLIAKFNLDTLLAYLKHLNLFVVNDTGPMHLAASVKTKILNISLGPVSMWETAPYSNNCMVLKADINCHPCSFSHKCSHLNCHEIITVESVLTAIKAFLKNETCTDENQVKHYKGLLDCYGFQHYVPYTKRVITKYEFLFEIKRAIWLESILEIEDSKYINYLWQHYSQKYFDFNNEILQINNINDDVNKLISQLMQFKRNAKKVGVGNWKDIKAFKQTIYEDAKKISYVYDYFLFANFCESSLSSNNLNVLLNQTVKIYKTLYSKLYKIVKHLRSFTCG